MLILCRLETVPPFDFRNWLLLNWNFSLNALKSASSLLVRFGDPVFLPEPPFRMSVSRFFILICRLLPIAAFFSVTGSRLLPITVVGVAAVAVAIELFTGNEDPAFVLLVFLLEKFKKSSMGS